MPPALAAPPHILTLTGNLLAEHTWELPCWSDGQTHRARAASFQVGGKGINVSRLLQRLGTPSTALCFPGGPAGDACLAWLRARQIPHHAFSSVNATRQGFVLRSENSIQPETTFLGPDSTADPAAIAVCAAHLGALASSPENHLAFCGSFPGWATSACDPLRTSLLPWLKRPALSVDTYGPPLAWFAQQPVYLLKINRTELLQLVPSAADIPSALAYARAHFHPQNWIITDGPRPVHLLARDHPLQIFTPPAIREISATGSGDILLAALLHFHLQQNLPLADALVRTIPYAAANAAHPGIADFDLNQFR